MRSPRPLVVFIDQPQEACVRKCCEIIGQCRRQIWITTEDWLDDRGRRKVDAAAGSKRSRLRVSRVRSASRESPFPARSRGRRPRTPWLRVELPLGFLPGDESIDAAVQSDGRRSECRHRAADVEGLRPREHSDAKSRDGRLAGQPQHPVDRLADACGAHRRAQRDAPRRVEECRGDRRRRAGTEVSRRADCSSG